MNVLLCWIGDTDYACAGVELPRPPRVSPNPGDLGPIAGAVVVGEYDRIVLLNNRAAKHSKLYLAWLRGHTDAEIVVHNTGLAAVTNHRRIYELVAPICEAEARTGADFTFHLSPGTPAMASIWLLLGKALYSAKLIQSSREQGVEQAEVPFDISAEFLPQLLKRLGTSAEERAPEHAAFSDIVHRSTEMKRVIGLAQRVASWPVPVLIEGESGTGKELFARAIHNASQRASEAFVPVNCGAIPPSIIEAELFGHEKGAFSGADKGRPGFFEQADGGTLFLDELGELPLDAQVKLLRVLENSEVRRVGAVKTQKVDVRVVAATNRSLLREVKEGRFREDLFYRLAVTRLSLPALRARQGDIGVLLEMALEMVNADGLKQVPGYEQKKLSAGAKSVLLKHSWPGNVRELMSTVRRAAIWSDGTTLSQADVTHALLDHELGSAGDNDRALGHGFSIVDHLAEVEKRYLQRAWEESGHVKTKAAELLGMPNYQTLSYRLKKHGIES